MDFADHLVYKIGSNLEIDMSKKSLSLLLVSLLVVYGVEWAASLFTRSSVGGWYVSLVKPSWNPPNWVFPVVWTLLYTSMGISLWGALKQPIAHKGRLLLPYSVQLALNFTWSWAFFYSQSPLLGLVNIILLNGAILWTIISFWSSCRWAALLLIPYFSWVLYATTLNLFIWLAN